MARPIVDGIEREFGAAVRVIRMNRHSPAGNALAARLGLNLVPGLMVFDGQGEVRLRKNGGVVSRQALATALKLG